jgi:hypothetical protein
MKRSKFVISKEIMANVAKTLPNDGFQLSPDLVGETLKIKKVVTPTYDGVQSFLATYEDSKGKVYNMPAGVFKGARVLTKTVEVPVSEKMEKYGEGIVLRGEAAEVWDKSSYLHNIDENNSMSEKQEFSLPETIKVHSIVIKQTPEGTPRINPFLYKGYRTVVDHYRKEKSSYPSWDEFQAELKKTENRIPTLSTEVKTVELNVPGREKDLRSMGFNLILVDDTAADE